MALDLSGLEPYVDENRIRLINNVTITAPSLRLFNVQTGIKCSAKLNLLNTEVTFGDCACGWDPEGKQEFTQRQIDVACIEINDSICDKDMRCFWTGYQVRLAAGRESLGTFEADFVEGIIADVIKKLDIAIYAGDKDSADPNLNKFDGLLKIVTNDAPAENVLPVAQGESVYNTALRVYAAIPNNAFKRGNVAILMGSDNFRRLVAELTAISLPAKPETIGEQNERSQYGIDYIQLPGTKVRVYGVEGLDGTNRIIGLSLNNVYYGTDLESDYEQVDFWYSKDNREWRYAIVFLAGIQVAFPDEIILGTISATSAAAAINVNILNDPLNVHNDGSFAAA